MKAVCLALLFLLTACGVPGEQAEPEPEESLLVLAAVRDGQAVGEQVIGFTVDGVFHGVQEDGINDALPDLPAGKLLFSNGSSVLYEGRVTGYRSEYTGSIARNVLYADVEFSNMPEDGLYLSVPGGNLPPDWSGRTKEGWSADLDGDGEAETCSMQDNGGEWTISLDGEPLDTVWVDGTYTTDFLVMPLDVDGDGIYEVAWASWGHNTSVSMYHLTENGPELVLDYYVGD